MESTSTPAGDGCTLFLDGVWRQCCDIHDIAYVAGGDKGAIDWALFECVAATGHPVMAVVMLAGVTLFGWLWWRAARRRN